MTPPDGPDPVLARVGAAVVADPARARELLDELWADIGADTGDPLHRCAVAHALADVQDDVAQELRWDERALAAAGEVTDERVTASGMAASAAALYPSLHLNVGECHRRLGNRARAAEHARLGLAATASLGDDGYARLVRDGLDRLARRVGN
ncbi:hypothetical protein SAMN05443575_3062 [Jatrophihabitans endophyticus]|uniref:Tetratricopeptide repeat-containing protein n=1 Tax=Jatrophihabitans endophyticus TaxID=1206085 RepID=A0A1M5PEX6_9ACTN|nr:hypothetical protein [Jatrophihabitans endophyticus]SHH00268.1 hypothetical protein SAMN05443575_3062 [Jatrophihabitans endophyticus]